MKIQLNKNIKVDLNDVLKINTQTYLVVSVGYSKKGTVCFITSNFRRNPNQQPIVLDKKDFKQIN